MLKNKIKLSLIDDYVKLVIFENFLNNDERNSTTLKIASVNSRLKKIYDELFKKLNMNDCSLLLLKKQLKQNSQLQLICNQQNRNDLLNHINSEINKISSQLKQKLGKLKVKPTELLTNIL